jgi:hypothetical protein
MNSQLINLHVSLERSEREVSRASIGIENNGGDLIGEIIYRRK